jgi:hypothetical protein
MAHGPPTFGFVTAGMAGQKTPGLLPCLVWLLANLMRDELMTPPTWATGFRRRNWVRQVQQPAIDRRAAAAGVLRDIRGNRLVLRCAAARRESPARHCGLRVLSRKIGAMGRRAGLGRHRLRAGRSRCPPQEPDVRVNCRSW